MRILIVDDNEQNLYQLQVLLGGNGYEVVTAVNGAEALAKARQAPPDIIISDILMPVMDGFSLCREWKKDEHLQNIPFIFYTATYTDERDREFALGLGAARFIVKPEEPEAFLRTIREVIRQIEDPPASPPQPAGNTPVHLPVEAPEEQETVYLKQYNAVLVRKLEAKMAQLEQINRELELDIAERKQVETRLREAETRYRTLFEQSPDGVVIIDTATVMPLEFNETAHRQLGYTREEFARLRLSDIDAMETPEDTRLRIAGVLHQGRSDFETLHRTKQGEIRNVHVTARVSDIQGNQVYHCIWRDITDRKRVEESNQRLAAAVEQAAEEIMITDATGTILYVNPAFERISGYTRSETVGRNPRMLKSDKHDTEFYRRMWTTLARGEVWEGSFINKRKDGSLYEEEAVISAIRDAAGRIINYVAVKRDITERVKNERLARRSQRLEAIGTLAGGVAHDLNNALAPIVMGVEMLREQYPKETEIIDLFQTSAKRATEMVRHLLSFARGAEGDRISIHPKRLLDEIRRIMKGTFPKNIEVTVKCDPKLPTVLGDITQLHQILLNLCVNARDAMPHGGTLTLEAQRQVMDDIQADAIPDAIPGNYVAVRVRDTGTGIAPEILDRIFDPFFTTKAPDKGTGLGLSTVMGIVKGHGGFVQVYSQPGQGSTFTAYLPAESSETVIAPAGSAEAQFSGQGETILFVDDEPDVREVARAVLRRLNFKPLTAIDGTDGLIQAAEHRTELRGIITDLHMPHMDGLGFVRALRRMLPTIPVVVASGQMDDRLAAEFRTLDVTNRLDKPFSEAQLAEALKILLAPK